MKKSLVLTTVLLGIASFSLSAADPLTQVGKGVGEVAGGVVNVTEKAAKSAVNLGEAAVNGTEKAVVDLGKGVKNGYDAVTK